MKQWQALHIGKDIFYPGLAAGTSSTRVLLDDPTVVSPLLNKMLRRAGVRKMNDWKYWQSFENPTWSSSKSFVQAWRERNTGDSDVAGVTFLLEEGTYEVRIYPYDARYKRYRILVISWVMFGIRGVFLAEDRWRRCDSCGLHISKPQRRCPTCKLIY